MSDARSVTDTCPFCGSEFTIPPDHHKVTLTTMEAEQDDPPRPSTAGIFAVPDGRRSPQDWEKERVHVCFRGVPWDGSAKGEQ